MNARKGMIIVVSVFVVLLLAVGVGGMASYAYRQGGWLPFGFALLGIVGVVATTWELQSNWWRLVSGLLMAGTVLVVNAVDGRCRAPARVT